MTTYSCRIFPQDPKPLDEFAQVRVTQVRSYDNVSLAAHEASHLACLDRSGNETACHIVSAYAAPRSKNRPTRHLPSRELVMAPTCIGVVFRKVARVWVSTLYPIEEC